MPQAQNVSRSSPYEVVPSQSSEDLVFLGLLRNGAFASPPPAPAVESWRRRFLVTEVPYEGHTPHNSICLRSLHECFLPGMVQHNIVHEGRRTFNAHVYV